MQIHSRDCVDRFDIKWAMALRSGGWIRKQGAQEGTHWTCHFLPCDRNFPLLPECMLKNVNILGTVLITQPSL